MDIIKSKVFARLDDARRILALDGGYTSCNIADPERWIQIDEGTGDRYNLCQTTYFPDGYLTGEGIPLYKWTGTEVIPRTEAEIQADRADLPPVPPTQQEKTHLLEQQVQALSEQNTFLEECIAEMASVVYA